MLKNSTCLITGADAGVGRGLALGFLERGARVGAGLLDAKKSASRVRGAVALQMDVTRPEQVSAAVKSFVRKTGRIDVLINNAGIYPRKAAEMMTIADWQRIMEINLTGVWRCCEAVIPHMKAQHSGVIINVGSIAQHAGLPELAHYHASKAGVIGLTRGLARDLGRFGIRVNCVNLGAVQTEGERAILSAKKALAFVNAKQCLKGRLTPASVEPVFAFLASDDSRDITGQCITVDRGWVHG